VKAAIPHGLYYDMVDETVIRPGEEEPVIKVHRVPTAMQIPDRFGAALNDLSFRVCYCSDLDQCWVTNLQSIRAEPVKECLHPNTGLIRTDPDHAIQGAG
jgi:hypothetical protein